MSKPKKKNTKPILLRETILLSDLKNLAETAYFMYMRDNKTWTDKSSFTHRWINKYKLSNPEVMVIRNKNDNLGKDQRSIKPKSKLVENNNNVIVPGKKESKANRKEQERAHAKMLAETSDMKMINPLPRKGVLVTYK